MELVYPLVSKALAFVVTLPASSAEVERVFSTMKRIKSPIRNRITTDTLDSLIRISMTNEEVHDWDPTAALKLWEGMGNRKLTTT